MKVGFLYQGLPGERPGSIAQWVEELGFDSIWVGDHVLSYVDGITAAAIFGAATDSITVGNAILVVPFRNAALLARSLATLCEELPDRYVLGCGAGGDVPAEFEAVGVPLAKRGARMEQTVATVREALDEGQLDGHPFEERPDGGCPPIWFGGRTERAARRAATLGDGFVPYLVTPSQYAELCELVRTTRASVAHGVDGFEWAVDVMVSVDPDPRRAWQAALDYRPYGLNEQRIRKYSVIGDPDTCIDGLRRYGDEGAEHLVLHVVAPPDEKRRQVECLAELLADLQSPHVEVT